MKTRDDLIGWRQNTYKRKLTLTQKVAIIKNTNTLKNQC